MFNEEKLFEFAPSYQNSANFKLVEVPPLDILADAMERMKGSVLNPKNLTLKDFEMLAYVLHNSRAERTTFHVAFCSKMTKRILESDFSLLSRSPEVVLVELTNIS
jgi:hypothetical protein